MIEQIFSENSTYILKEIQHVLVAKKEEGVKISLATIEIFQKKTIYDR